MSIAVSAIVNPSRRLWWTASSFCIAIAVIGIAIGMGWLGNFTGVTRTVLAGATVICSLFALLHLRRNQKAYLIDIGGDGTLRLLPCNAAGAMHAQAESASLLDGSTLWAGLMLVCLQLESGQTIVLHILPDSVSQQEYRALSVALRWVAAHGGEMGEQQLQDANLR